ncbi:VanZ family protein [Mucilaginibacter hurinus]|nr:VanZ family protein [Mucilaginibacter hurinus]
MSVEKIGQPPRFFEGFDKLTHCGLFFVLAVFCCNGYLRHQRTVALPFTTLVFITIAIILYGGVIELLQQYIFTWRSGDWWDLFADAVGTCMGMFAVVLTLFSAQNVEV